MLNPIGQDISTPKYSYIQLNLRLNLTEFYDRQHEFYIRGGLSRMV